MESSLKQVKKLFGKINLRAVSGEWIWQKLLTCYFFKNLACQKIWKQIGLSVLLDIHRNIMVAVYNECDRKYAY